MTWNKYVEKHRTEYSNDWYFYPCEIIKISIFFHKEKNIKFNVLKKLSFINKPIYQNSVRGFQRISVTDRVGVVIDKC